MMLRAALVNLDPAAMQQLDVVAILVQPRQMRAPAPDALLGQQDIGQRHRPELRLVDEAAIAGGVRGLHIDIHIDIADRFAPRGIALGGGEIVGREYLVHRRLPACRVGGSPKPVSSRWVSLGVS